MDTPTPQELFAQAIESRLEDLHTAFPAKVVKFSADDQTVQVSPVISRAVYTGDDTPPTLERLPEIPAVPVVYPRGGGFFLTFPIAEGDHVLIVCSERDISEWRATGAAGNPGDHRLHPLGGAIAIPGLFPRSKALAGVDGANLTIGKEGGITVTLTPSRLEVGGAADAAALASKVDGALSDIAQAFATFSPGDSTASFPNPYNYGGSTASDQIKVDS